jgi:hypothetical protein
VSERRATEATPIEQAIASYANRAGGAGGRTAPYDSKSLAAIYAPRAQQLVDLQNRGYTHAEWRWDAALGHNRWFGVTS